MAGEDDEPEVKETPHQGPSIERENEAEKTADNEDSEIPTESSSQTKNDDEVAKATPLADDSCSHQTDNIGAIHHIYSPGIPVMQPPPFSFGPTPSPSFFQGPLCGPGPGLEPNRGFFPDDPSSVQLYYEARMRDHAAAYASAAAGAAWAAAQIAQAAASNIHTAQNHINHGPHPYHNHHQLPMRLPDPPSMTMIPPHTFSPTPHPPFPPFVPESPHYVPETGPNQVLCHNAHPPHNNDNSESLQHSPKPKPQGSPSGAEEIRNVEHSKDPAAPPGVFSGRVQNDSASDTSFSNHHRRKRQQRLPPSETIHESSVASLNNQRFFQLENNKPRTWIGEEQARDEKRGTRRRNRYDNSPANSETEQLPSSKSRRRKTFRKLPSSGSDGGNSSAGFHRPQHKRKQRQITDESLLGKSGVSALFEWANKRKLKPPILEILPPSGASPGLREYFEVAASINGVEYGRGEGYTKSAAKQEAARHALQAIYPGIEFDSVTGVVTHLPDKGLNPKDFQGPPPRINTSLEDLAPNLAKSLAIGHDDDDKNLEKQSPRVAASSLSRDLSVADSKKRHGLQVGLPSMSSSDARQQKRLCPGSFTTTSEEEDEDAYYTSRGASVCNALLHAMVQINDRISEPPVFTFQNMAIPLATGKRKAGHSISKSSSSSPRPSLTVGHRGPFVCVATLNVREKSAKGQLGDDKLSESRMVLLQSTGAGGTKREARQMAAAKLLALLFPECNGMAQVKQAAEEFREKYAAEKMLKQQAKNDLKRSEINQENINQEPAETRSQASSEMNPNAELLGRERKLRSGSTSSGSLASYCCEQEADKEALCQGIFPKNVSQALQRLNQRDAGGRRIPDELTADDVGRTLLRQAKQDDAHWIESLFGQSNKASRQHSSTDAISILKASAATTEGSSESPDEDGVKQSSEPSGIVVLLCRAIAPYDDPPLGCAVLTAPEGNGRSLIVSQIVTMTHLPEERFIECLQSLAESMGYALESSASSV